MIDTYKTIEKPSEETLFKEKNSKFYGYAFPVRTEEECKEYIEEIKKKHHTARHWCYAYQLGVKNVYYRANDDGEPSNTAGMPIYGQIQSFEVTNVLIVVVRYFGGVKLGVGGLISAYREGARLALEASEIVEKTVDQHFLVSCDYKNLNKVMRVIKEKQLDIVHQKMELSCEIEIKVRLKQADEVFEAFNQIYEVEIEPIEE